MITRFIKKNYLLVLFLLFFLIRLPLLDQINLLHDERDTVLTGYSLARTGRDLYGNFMPLTFNRISPNGPFITFYYSALWWLFIPLRTIFTSRLPFVFISGLMIFLVYKLIFILTKDKVISLLTTVIYCFSPWIFHVTRLAFDIPLSMIFLLLGTIYYLRKQTLLSYFMFFLSFYSYQGFRILIPFLIIYLELYFLIKDKDSKQFIKKNLFNIFFVALLIISAVLVDRTIIQNRANEIAVLSPQRFTNTVIFKRNTSIAPDAIKSIFNNKATAIYDYLVTNLVKGQDMSYLFKDGDYSAINGNAVTGQFLLFFIFSYYLGFVYFGYKLKWVNFFIFGLTFVTIIPSLLSLNGVSFSTRSMMSGVGYSFVISCGLIFGYELIKKLKKKLRRIIIGSLILLLLINLSSFIYNYYFRRPVTISEIFNENERQLSKYILSHSSDKLTVYHQQPKELYLSLAFFDNNIDIKEVQKKLVNQTHYLWHNYYFLTCDNKIDYRKLSNSIIAENCLDKKNYDYFNDKNNKTVKEKIPYKDYSTKTAYFVIE